MTIRTRALAALLIAASLPAARADRIKLRGGGEIKGVVVADSANPTVVSVVTAQSAKPLTLEKGAILSVIREPGPLSDYVVQRAKLAATAQAHYDFGLWCEESDLRGPAQVEFAKALELDPEFAPAHKKLGHVQHGEKWLTPDQQREAQGLIKRKGKWITKAEKDKLDESTARAAEQSSWTARLKILRRKLNDANPPARDDAEAQISAIRDPAAIPGLVRIFGGDGDAVRVRLAQLVGAIAGPEATEALVNLIVAEADGDVRQAMLDEVARRRDPEAPNRLIAALKAKDPIVVGRAAWALAALKHKPAVPKLVDALFYSEKRITMLQVARPAANGFSGSVGFAQNVSGGLNVPGGANRVAAGSNVASSGYGVTPPVADSAKGFATVAGYGYLTPPAVGPDGSIAFGASSVPVPVGNTPVQGGGVQVSEIPAKVKMNYQNPEVLKALQSLTGVNLGYDPPAWKKWITASFRIEPEAPRRVPKP